MATRPLDLSAMENCVCLNLRWVSRAVTRFFDAELRRHGVRGTQTPLLGALAAKPEWSMAELSDWLGMERTTLLRNLRPLQRQGHVRAEDGGRGGKVALSITRKGRAALAGWMPAWRAAQKAVVATLGPARWSAMLRDLDAAALALQEK